MTLHGQWTFPSFDQPAFHAGQGYSSFNYTDEPSRIDGEIYGIHSAMSFTMDETYMGQNNADSLDEFPPLMTPLGVSAHQVNTGLTYDPYEFNKIAPYRSRSPCLRWPKKEPGVSHSVSSIDTECSNEDEQRHVCQECNKLFKNLQELDQHAKKTPHRAWRCAEPFCDKTYARRDTFLRHRATHKDKSHPCPVCPRLNKQKVFKRKDHLREHIRNCHSKVIEATGVESVRYV